MNKTLIAVLMIAGLYGAEIRETFPASACFYVGDVYLKSDSCVQRIALAIEEANRYGADFIIDEQVSNRYATCYREDGQYIFVDWWRYALAANLPKELIKEYPSSYPLRFPFADKDTIYSFYIKYPYHLGIITKYLTIVGFDLDQKSNGLQAGDKVVKINDISVSDHQAMNQLLQINESTPVKVSVLRQNQYIDAWFNPLKVSSKPKTISKPKPTSDNIEFYSRPPRRASIYLGQIGASFLGNKLNATSYEDAKKLGADYITILPFSNTFDTVKGGFIHHNEIKKYASQAALSRSSSSYYPKQKPRETNSYSAWAFLPSSLGIITSNDYMVIGFDPDSKAFGMQVNDEILGINGIDRSQDNYLLQLLSLYPGDTVTLNISRNGQRLDVKIEAIQP